MFCCAISATKATSSRRLDTALLCAAKKRGVETTRLAGYCQLKLAPAATHGRIKKKGDFRRPKTLIHFWSNVHRADIRRRSHVNAGDDAHGKEHCDNRAAAIAEKRECQTDDRENAEADTDIDDRL